jgi:xanthine/CO dehydrogenase XdhC/CoxF family maturation factor
LRPSSTHSARHRANPAPTRREVRHRERPLRRLRFGRLRRVRCGRARTAGIRGRRAANLIHYGVSDDDAFEVGLSCGGKIDVWLERADPEFWLEVRALLDNDEYGCSNEHRNGRQLATTTRAHALDPYVGKSDELRHTWANLDLSHQHAIVAAILDHLVVGPARRGYNQFDETRLTPHWRT